MAYFTRENILYNPTVSKFENKWKIFKYSYFEKKFFQKKFPVQFLLLLLALIQPYSRLYDCFPQWLQFCIGRLQEWRQWSSQSLRFWKNILLYINAFTTNNFDFIFIYTFQFLFNICIFIELIHKTYLLLCTFGIILISILIFTIITLRLL